LTNLIPTQPIYKPALPKVVEKLDVKIKMYFFLRTMFYLNVLFSNE